MKPETGITVDGTQLIFIRPLLRVWKDQIRDFARKRRLKFSEDGTNAENRFTRNRIRNLLVPEIERVLEPVHSGLNLAAVMQRSRPEESELLRQLTPDWWELDELLVRDMKTLPVALQRRVIHQWLSRHEISDAGVEEVERIRSMLTPNREIAKVNLLSSLIAAGAEKANSLSRHQKRDREWRPKQNKD